MHLLLLLLLLGLSAQVFHHHHPAEVAQRCSCRIIADQRNCVSGCIIFALQINLIKLSKHSVNSIFASGNVTYKLTRAVDLSRSLGPDLGWGAEDQSTMQPVDMTVKLAAGVVERLGAGGCRISLLSLLGEIMRLINFDCSGRVWQLQTGWVYRRDAAEWGGGSCDDSGAQYRRLKLFSRHLLSFRSIPCCIVRVGAAPLSGYTRGSGPLWGRRGRDPSRRPPPTPSHRRTGNPAHPHIIHTLAIDLMFVVGLRVESQP